MLLGPPVLVQESATSATFVIEGKSNIPSGDGAGMDEKTHKVVVAVIDMSANLEWVVVPKEQASAFLRVSNRLNPMTDSLTY